MKRPIKPLDLLMFLILLAAVFGVIYLAMSDPIASDF